MLLHAGLAHVYLMYMAITIASSNLNLPYLTSIAGGVEGHEQFLREAGYARGSEASDNYVGGGYEWHEIRNVRYLGSRALPGELLRAGHITSLHQSWRSTHWWQRGANMTEPRSLFEVFKAAGMGLAIPFIDNSLDRLAELSKQVQGLLPVVVHPNEQQRPGVERFEIDYPKYEGQFSQLRHQLTAETLRSWGVLSSDASQVAKGVLQVQRNRGLHRPVWSTLHSEENRYGDSSLRIPKPLEVIGALGRLGSLPELQINLTDEGDIRRILDGGFEFSSHGQAVEAALGAIGSQDLLMVTMVKSDQIKGDITEAHRELVTAISNMLPAAA